MQQQRVCAVETCEKKTYRHSAYCRPHDRANTLYGDPLIVKQQQWHGLSLRERFLKYVTQTPNHWEWVGAKDAHQYGRLNVKDYPELAHRLSWRLFCGEIPEEKDVLHKCHMPSCVNPEHLYLGTHQDNMDDKMEAGRHRYGHLQGTAHGMAKLTEEDVREILSSPEKGTVIAKRKGVSKTTVYDIRARRIWQHIT